MKRIAIIAGETSGDILGSRLIASLKQLNPQLQFEGIGGAEMAAQGCDCLYPMEKLAVMGLTEVLKRLPELLNIRRTLIKRWSRSRPDLVIGIDAPDFNLRLEAELHRAGIKVAHYVSPSVWAWRSKRVNKMKGNLDLMLTLFPFEASFYQQHAIPVAFVGHPLADEIPLVSDRQAAREALGLDSKARVLAILPGSRSTEIKYLAKEFVQTAQQLSHEYNNLIFIAPMVNKSIQQLFEKRRKEVAPELDIQLIQGQSRQVMAAADVLLMASGTAVLEGMFVGRPMVAAGKMSALTAWVFRRFAGLRVKYFTLPNNLANQELVPEFIQEDMTTENLTRAVKQMFEMKETEEQQLLDTFTRLHQQLRKNASATAAKVLAEKFNLT